MVERSVPEIHPRRICVVEVFIPRPNGAFLMKHISLIYLAIVLMIASVGEADESNDFDREDRRPPPDQTQRRDRQLPPPLRVFDKNQDNALSPEEIQDLAERL